MLSQTDSYLLNLTKAQISILNVLFARKMLCNEDYYRTCILRVYHIRVLYFIVSIELYNACILYVLYSIVLYTIMYLFYEYSTSIDADRTLISSSAILLALQYQNYHVITGNH